jgi:hypothetical protein
MYLEANKVSVGTYSSVWHDDTRTAWITFHDCPSITKDLAIALRNIEGPVELFISGGSELTPEFVESIGPVNVYAITFSGLSTGDTECELVRRCQTLHAVRALECDVSPTFFEAVHDSTAVDLTLHGCTFEDRFLQYAGGMHRLSISYCNVSDEGISRLCEARHLQHLTINRVPISDKGLVALGVLPRLTYLDAVGTNVTDQGVSAFNAVRSARGYPPLQIRLQQEEGRSVESAPPKTFYGDPFASDEAN